MDLNIEALACVAIITFVFVIPSWLYIEYTERRAKQERDAAEKAGRNQPVTIQPLVDMARCMGSGTCATACPEDVLAIIEGQAVAVNMSACVGHGVCVEVCPVDAIELVFGSDKRGIDIPEVNGNFETNVPGLFVAGELGGMGLIAKAAEQGAKAMQYALEGVKPSGTPSVIIVGAGPAGIAAALQAKSDGHEFLLLEQDEVGGAVLHFPRKKLVFTSPMHFPLYGSVNTTSMQKEELMDLFNRIIQKTGIRVSSQERVDAIQKLPNDQFKVKTSKGEHQAPRVMLCLGRRGTPRTLNVPGEKTSDKVAYSLLEPDQFQYSHVLVVGGGDSAVEAACTLAEEPGNRVTLSYRKKKINRPKAKNVERLRNAVRDGDVELILESNVTEIGEDRVILEQSDEQVVLPNDYVFVFIGGVLPTDFLQKAGVRIRRHFGKRVEDADFEEPKSSKPATSKAGFHEAPTSIGAGPGLDLLPIGSAAPSGEPTMALPDPDKARALGAALTSVPSGEATMRLDPADLPSIPSAGEPTQIRIEREAPPPPSSSTSKARSVSIPSRPRAAPPHPSNRDDGHTQPIDLSAAKAEPQKSGSPGRIVASKPEPHLTNLTFGSLPSSNPQMAEAPLNTSAFLSGSLPAKPMNASRLASLLERARIQAAGGQLDEAERSWEQARVAAEDAKHVEALGQAMRGLAETKAVRGHLIGALDAVSHAETLMGNAQGIRADLLAMAIELELALGNLSPALARVEQLLEIVNQHSLADHRALGASLLSETMARLGFEADAGDAALQAVEFTGQPGASHAVVRERAARILCDLGRDAEAEQATQGLPPADDRSVDDPKGQRMALLARITASVDPIKGRQLAEQALTRPTPPFGLRAARIRLDAAQALMVADQPNAARAAIKRALKSIQGSGARGAKLELLLAFHQANPDHRVAEAAARSALQLMDEMPDSLRKSFENRSSVNEVLRRWRASR